MKRATANGLMLRGVLRVDLERVLGRSARRWDFAVRLVTDSGYLAVALYRVQQRLQPRSRHLAMLVSRLNQALTAADFVVGCEAGPGLVVRHPAGIVVGAGVRMGRDCTLQHGVTLGERHVDGRGPHLYPRIGDRVTLCTHAVVVGGIDVGDDAVVGALAFVDRDVPEGQLAVGAPASHRARSPKIHPPEQDARTGDEHGLDQ